MCLLVKSYHLSEEPIECYKVLRRQSVSDELTSPFAGFIWEVGKTYTDEAKEIFVPSGNYSFPLASDLTRFPKLEPQYKGELSQGVFHAFKTLEGAEELRRHFRLEEIPRLFSGDAMRIYVIAKCVIPKDTWFCSGEDTATGCECYGSKVLTITGIL